MIEKSISEHLEGDDSYKVCFWTTYTVDFPTVDYIHRHHIGPKLESPQFHLIVDARELSKSALLVGRLKDVERLSRKAIVSAVYSKVAFHPKIIFFASENKIEVIITSGNATPTGVLSNIDLIAKFVFDSENQVNTQSGFVAEIYRFLKELPYLNKLTKTALENLANLHPWLLEDKQEAFLSTQKGILFDQIKDRLAGESISEISIYSPSFDPDLQAVQHFKKSWPNAKVNVWVGHQNICLNSKSTIEKLKQNGINIYDADCLYKGKFHAKAFFFKLKNNETKMFWGSANCSRAALFNMDSNHEILFLKTVDQDFEEELFEKYDNPEIISSEKIVLNREAEDSLANFQILIREAAFEGQSIQIDCNELHEYKLRAISLVDQVEKATDIDLELVEGRKYKSDVLSLTPLVVYLVDKAGLQVSNAIVVNQPDQVFASNRISIQSLEAKLQKENLESLDAIDYLMQFQSMDASDGSNKNLKSPSGFSDIWTQPEVRINLRWGSIFTQSIVHRIQEANGTNLDEDDLDPEDNLVAKIKPNKRSIELERLFLEMKKRFTKRNLSLFGEETRNVLDIDNWAQAIEFALQVILSRTEKEKFLSDDIIALMCETLREIARTGLYILKEKVSQRLFEVDKATVVRLNTFSLISDLNFYLSNISYKKVREMKNSEEVDLLYSQKQFYYSVFLQRYMAFLQEKVGFTSSSPLQEIIERVFEGKSLAFTAQQTKNNVETQKVNFLKLPLSTISQGVTFTHEKIGECLVSKVDSNEVHFLTLSEFEKTRKFSAGHLLVKNK